LSKNPSENLIKQAHFTYLGGVIDTEHLMQFKRLVIRATKCHVFVYAYELDVPLEDQLVGDDYHNKKSVFILAFQEGSLLQEKVRKICQAFPNELYEIDLESIDE
jgi:hypothetical protein